MDIEALPTETGSNKLGQTFGTPRQSSTRPDDELDALPGVAFERFLKLLFTSMGLEAELTPTHDQGADLIVEIGKVRFAVQAKRAPQPIGNDAIQQVLGGMTYYRCDRGILITTAPGFTKSAKELASRDSRILLWGKETLMGLIRAVLRS